MRHFFNPAAAWLDFATVSTQMLLAAAQVIPKRVARMAGASTPLSARDAREFKLMSQEKREATQQSLADTSRSVLKQAPRWAGQLAAQTRAWNALGLALAGSRTASALFAQQAKATRAIRGAAKLATSGSTDAAKLAKASVQPLQKRATANAKRLRKS